MRLFEITSDHPVSKFIWTAYTNMPVNDKLELAEGLLSESENLFESNDSGQVDYFFSLRGMSDSAELNKTYIINFLGLINNRVLTLQEPFIGKILQQIEDQFKIELPDGRTAMFPDKSLSDKMATSMFFFKDNVSYDKFRTAIKLKFSKDLPEI